MPSYDELYDPSQRIAVNNQSYAEKREAETKRVLSQAAATQAAQAAARCGLNSPTPQSPSAVMQSAKELSNAAHILFKTVSDLELRLETVLTPCSAFVEPSECDLLKHASLVPCPLRGELEESNAILQRTYLLLNRITERLQI